MTTKTPTTERVSGFASLLLTPEPLTKESKLEDISIKVKSKVKKAYARELK